VKLTLSASTASGLERACRKLSDPAFFASQRSAEIGRKTMTSRYVETAPSARAVEAPPPAPILRER
jgi:hypothetical protein